MKYLLLTALLTLAIGASPAWAGNVPIPSEKERKLLELEAQVAALERKAFELKQKIQVISDKVFKKKFNQGSPKLTVLHTNKMAGYFHIMSLTYTLIKTGGNKQLLSKTADVKQKMPNQIKVYQGNLPKGSYQIKVVAKVRGYNPILTYINNYKITLQNSIPFRANVGRIVNIGVEFTDTRGKEIEKRLRIIFRVAR